jgi:hypothetical protein
MIHTLFPSNNAVFLNDSAPFQTAGFVQSWFKEYGGEFQHFSWSAQSPGWNTIEQL